MDRPPLPLPLPRPKPGEAIVTTALAGALGLATWACVPFLAFAARLVPLVAMVVTPVAFHWLCRGLMTEENWPERKFLLPRSSTAVRIGFHAFAFAPLVASGAGGLAVLWTEGIDPLAIAFAMVLVATFGVVVWGPVTLAAVVAYGMPLRDATAAMDAAYPDVVDRAVVRTHARLAIAAAFPVIVGALGYLRAGRATPTEQLHGGPLAFTAFLFLGLLAVAVPVGVALRAKRRLAARKAWPTRELHLVPIAEQTAERLAKVPILGDGTAPTHALVRVATAEAYRVAATHDEALALIAVADEDAYARATDISSKER
jgi:hypothetical protein